MNIPSLISRFTGQGNQDEVLIRKVSDACLSNVWSQVSHRVTELRRYEARGYIRARSYGLVQHHLEREVRNAAQRQRIATMVMDDLIQRTLGKAAESLQAHRALRRVA